MTLLMKQIFAFFRLLNSDTGHNQLAAGLACGIILGFSPFLSLQTFIVIFLLFFFRIQIGAAFLSAFFFKFIAWLADPIADTLGRQVLESPPMRPLFVELYNMPLVPMTRFNNSIVMGSMIFGFLLAVPAFFLFRSLILKYRVTVVSRFEQTRFWKAWKATKIYGWYSTYEKLYL
ncbi:MAG: TIGR03546 family protein [Bdellovibrionaceae bacterium]|nr:TIGR03546 family protein [Pseudobdellovibrionaceae bacterium]MBX3032402.1 TIGR03546 family protein [Pseudobdellovibrionaceae bacterium]